MTRFLARAFTAIALASLGMGGPAAAAVPRFDDLSPMARERALTQWYLASTWMNRMPALDALTPERRQVVMSESQGLEEALTKAQVLANAHAWPAGCAPFKAQLDTALAAAQTPLGIDAWREWRAVYRVTCSDPAPETAALVAAFARLPAWSAPSWKPDAAAPSLFLEPLPPAAWECMRLHVPVALRQGLDRHEGLASVGKACGLDASSVFGQALTCDDCAGHPRAPRDGWRRALVIR